MVPLDMIVIMIINEFTDYVIIKASTFLWHSFCTILIPTKINAIYSNNKCIDN